MIRTALFAVGLVAVAVVIGQSLGEGPQLLSSGQAPHVVANISSLSALMQEVR